MIQEHTDKPYKQSSIATKQLEQGVSHTHLGGSKASLSVTLYSSEYNRKLKYSAFPKVDVSYLIEMASL